MCERTNGTWGGEYRSGAPKARQTKRGHSHEDGRSHDLCDLCAFVVNSSSPPSQSPFTNSAYCSAVINFESSSLLTDLSLKNQPAPSGSAFTLAGSAASA